MKQLRMIGQALGVALVVGGICISPVLAGKAGTAAGANSYMVWVKCNNTGAVNPIGMCADSEGEAVGFAQDHAFPQGKNYGKSCGSTSIVKVKRISKKCK